MPKLESRLADIVLRKRSHLERQVDGSVRPSVSAPGEDEGLELKEKDWPREWRS